MYKINDRSSVSKQNQCQKIPAILLFLFSNFLLVSCNEQKVQNVSNKVKQFIEANGELASNDTVVISPPFVSQQWQYKITYIAPEGSQIKKGVPLIKFDSSQITQKLAIKQSELNTSKKSLENIHLTTKAELEQQKLKLAEAVMKENKEKRKWKQSKGLESNLEVKKLSIAYQLAVNETKRIQRIKNKKSQATKVKIALEKSKVERLNLESQELQAGIQKMIFKSPKDGMIMYKSDHNGDKISSGDTVWRGRQLIELPSIDKMIVKAQILEADAGKIKLNQSVEIRLDAVPERVFKGKISLLGKVFRRKSKEQANIIFDADITLDIIDSDLMRPGMTTRIKVLLNEI